VPPTGSDCASLKEALQRGWVEFWYQPKIDLRRKQVVGVETFARVRLPTAVVLPPAEFLPGADADTLTSLTERALVSALETSAKLSKLGLNLQIAVNVSTECLRKLPIGEIVRTYRSARAKWPGLIFDMTEHEIIDDIPLIGWLASSLQPYGIHLAMDNFGRCLWNHLQNGDQADCGHTLDRTLNTVVELKQVSFVELKLDRAVVTECGDGARGAGFCKAIIELAHYFGGRAVAIGVERLPDVEILQRMNCDIGQGTVFTPPLSQQQFMALMHERAAKQGRPTPAG